eukprot:scpid63024/ scgid29364/ Tubulin-specific chaperone cofactor E-like protein; Leucine-rich repeat-containing protein 35
MDVKGSTRKVFGVPVDQLDTEMLPAVGEVVEPEMIPPPLSHTSGIAVELPTLNNQAAALHVPVCELRAFRQRQREDTWLGWYPPPVDFDLPPADPPNAVPLVYSFAPEQLLRDHFHMRMARRTTCRHLRTESRTLNFKCTIYSMPWDKPEEQTLCLCPIGTENTPNVILDTRLLPGFLDARTVTTLCLSDQGYKKIPKVLVEFVHLEALVLDNNHIRKIPKDVLDNLFSLEAVSLADNNLRSVAHVIIRLRAIPSLRSVSLQGNPCMLHDKEESVRTPDTRIINALPFLQRLNGTNILPGAVPADSAKFFRRHCLFGRSQAIKHLFPGQGIPYRPINLKYGLYKPFFKGSKSDTVPLPPMGSWEWQLWQ